jgi:uncharacterized protein
MELASQQTLHASQTQAWEALNDIDLLKQCIPGCEAINPTGENQYEVLVTAAIGPVKAKFKGKLKLENLQPPHSYTLQFEGQGGAAGHGKGSAEVTLTPISGHATQLSYKAKASVGGKIAQIGSRLVDMAAQKMAGEFFAAFSAKLEERHPRPADAAPAPAPAAPQGFFAKLVAAIKRLFGG